jgi:hypothetical protein
MARTEKQTDKAALAAAAFGRSAGVDMTILVREGAEGLNRMRAEATKLGLVFGEDMVRGAERAKDSLFRMERIVTVNAQKIALSLTPVIEDLALAFTDAAPKIQAAAEAVASFILGIDIKSIQTMNLEIEAIDKRIVGLKESRDLLGTSLLRLDPFDVNLGLINRGIASLEKQRVTIEENIKTREKELEIRRKLLKQNDDTDDSSEKFTDRQLKSAQRLLDGLRGQKLRAFGEDEELETLRFNRQMDAISRSALNEEERNEARVLAAQTTELRLQDIRRDSDEWMDRQVSEAAEQILRIQQNASIRMQAIWKSGLDGQLSITSGILGQIASLQSSQSRKMFEVGKAAAIAQTTIDTFRAAQGAYASLAGIPIVGPALGIAAAAAAVLSGIARVQQIKAQTFGGGGGASGGGGGGGGGAPAAAATQQTAPAISEPLAVNQVPQRKVNFTFTGIFTAAMIRDIVMPQIEEAVGDGVSFNVTILE